jgi:hypothetical protein
VVALPLHRGIAAGAEGWDDGREGAPGRLGARIPAAFTDDSVPAWVRRPTPGGFRGRGVRPQPVPARRIGIRLLAEPVFVVLRTGELSGAMIHVLVDSGEDHPARALSLHSEPVAHLELCRLVRTQRDCQLVVGR